MSALLATGCGGADATSDGRAGSAGASSAGRGGASGTAGSSGGAAASGDGDRDGDGHGFGNGDGGPMSYGDASVTGDGGGVIRDPDDQTCGGTAVEPMITMETIPGNVLLVFDRSRSMTEPYPATGNPKWEDARDAVLSAITPLQDQVTVGAIFFPHTPSCAQGDICCVPEFGTAPQIDFMPGADFITAWNDFWASAPLVDGSTPTLEALQVAGQALTDTMGTLDGTTTVVLITDGDPRCAVEAAEPRSPTPDEIAGQVISLSELPALWLPQGVSTHVLGLPGADQPGAVTVLNGIALAGGTTMHISAADPTTLQTELAKIIGESVTTSFQSCSIGLPREPPNPDDVVLVVVEGGTEQSVARDLGTGGGWTMRSNNTEIVLQGELCNQARAGTYDKISVVFGCVDLPPLPPPKPE